MLKFFFIMALITTSALAEVKRIECAKPSLPPMSREEMNALLIEQKVSFLDEAAVTDEELRDFLKSFIRFPTNLQRELVKFGGRVLLIHGKGVSEDPDWKSASSKTIEGKREWSDVPGAGGFPPTKTPTRIVVNRLSEENQGPADLFLHEHAHTLDSIFGERTISKSAAWLSALRATPNLKAFLDVWSPDSYNTTYPKETFAELFDQYYACDETREQIERELPAIAEFFKNFDTVNGLREEFQVRTRLEKKAEKLATKNRKINPEDDIELEFDLNGLK